MFYNGKFMACCVELKQNLTNMEGFIEYLEKKIEGCDNIGGLQREKAVYQSVLKDFRKQCAINGVVFNEAEKDDIDLSYFKGKSLGEILNWNDEKSEVELVCPETKKPCKKQETYYCNRLCERI